MNTLITFLRSRNAVGKSNAIRRGHIAGFMGISIREVKLLADSAVEEYSVPVCWSTDSESGGIYIAEDHEIEEAIQKATRLAHSILRRRSALKRIKTKTAEKTQSTLF